MLRNSTIVYLFAILYALTVTPAEARPRSFVASYGSDTNPCGPFLPCATFAKAVSVTDTNGEVVALDSSGYGPVTLDKSVSLTAPPGVFVGIAVSSVGESGVTIEPGVNNVVLRGLTINGLGGDNGIWMKSSGNLSIENCVISNFWGLPRRGVLVTTAATVRMVDSLVRHNDSGIELQDGATAIISKSRFLGNDFGIFANGAALITTVIVRDTFVTGGTTGISALSQIASANNQIYVTRSTISNNFNGVSSEAYPGTALVTISKSMVTRNNFGFYMLDTSGGSATVKSYGNNTVTDNINDTTDPLTPVSTM